jgi:hypothetical protein
MITLKNNLKALLPKSVGLPLLYRGSACPARPVKFFREKERSEFNQGEIFTTWNSETIPVW